MKETFQYTYSAKEQEEIKKIRMKYSAPPQEDKMTALRRLDAAVTKKATSASLVFGLIGTLVLGLGMSLAMTDIGQMLGMQEGTDLLFGIIIGLIGIIVLSVAYPVYNRIIKKERKKIAPEIIRLSDELLQ